ncbi:MAG: ABC transporter permease, partial [Deltaproteobacteria bacterium]|nr:ABC transporter permease [Deltaproteobacteria bacterium]
MSNASDIVSIAARNLVRNSRRTLMTGSMVALGVVAIVFFRAYIAGLQDQMFEMVVENQSGALQVERQGYSKSRELAPLDLDLPQGEGLEEKVRQGPGVKQVAPRLRFGAVLVFGEASTVVHGLGVEPELEKQVCPQSPQAGHRYEGKYGERYGLEGPGLAEQGEASILLGSSLASGLGIRIGDQVTLLAQTSTSSTDAVDATVRGIFKVGDAEVNKRSVVVPLGLAQRLLHMPGRMTSLAVAVSRPQIEQAAVALRGALASAQPSVDVWTWGQMAPYYRDVIQLQDDIMGIVTALLFVILLSGVANTMMMSVFERQREIGTLMAIGFRRRSIAWLFVI